MVIDNTSTDQVKELPACLTEGKCLNFDKILFIVYGERVSNQSALLRQFTQHFEANKEEYLQAQDLNQKAAELKIVGKTVYLPPNVCMVKESSLTYLAILLGHIMKHT